MRSSTGATHGGASASMRPPAAILPRSRASSGCAISASPIQVGATTRMRAGLMMWLVAFVEELRPAVRAERASGLGDVQEYARVARPERRAGHRAVQRQVLLPYLDFPCGIRGHRLFP